MELEVALVVVAVNLKERGNHKILLLEAASPPPRLPTKCIMDDETCVGAAAVLLQEYTGLDVLRWPALRLVQAGVFDLPERERDRRVVTLSYGVMIPETTRLEGRGNFGFRPRWFTTSEVHEMQSLYGDHRDILFHVASRL